MPWITITAKPRLTNSCNKNKGNELFFRLRHLEGANIEAERNYGRPTAKEYAEVRRQFLSLSLHSKTGRLKNCFPSATQL